MAAAWLTNTEIKTDLMGFLAKKAAGTISDRWDTIINRANGKARSDIIKVLKSSGFSTSQINSWDYLSEHHSQQSIFWTLVYGTALHNLEYNEVKMLDVRKDLKEMDELEIGGESATPDNMDDMIQVGDADFTGSDFRPDSPLGDLNFRQEWKTSRVDDDNRSALPG